MAKFKFRLQAVLDHHAREMKTRQHKLDMVRAELRQNLEQQAAVRGEIQQMEGEFLGLIRGRANPEEFMSYPEYRHRLESSLEELMLQQEEIEHRVREAEAALLEAARSHRRLEIHKERAYEEWQAEIQRKELEQMDEWGGRSSAAGR